jgi:bifunctional DNA-binding transcriptional regulator/antitoxin component of YhaV-PrlF toxin-antitoxin module
MPHYEARMKPAGEIEIPLEVREFYALKDGDCVDFYVDPGRRTVEILARNAKTSELLGSLGGSSVAPFSPQAMDDAIGDYLGEKHDRISRQWNEWREFQEWKKAKAAE